MFHFNKFNQSEVSLKKATMINAFSKYSTVIMGLLFSAILARLISPKDYGVVAIVTVFTNFFALFSDMGIGTAVIQNKTLSKEDENCIFTFTVYMGILLAIVFSAFSVVLTKIYNNHVYLKIGPLLGVSLALRTFDMVPNAKLMKSKQFLQSAIRTISTTFVGYIAAIFIAVIGGKYYAIIAQALFTSFVGFLWNYVYTGIKFSKNKVMKSVKKIWGFSSYQFGFSFINYFSRNLDNLLTGYFFGDTELGFYDKAYKLMRYPVDNLTNVLTPSIQPILSEHQDDPRYILRQYNKMVKFLALIAVYISTVCFFASKEIILLFFGKQWEGAVISFHYLSAALVFQIVGGVSGSIYQSVNKTKEMFWAGIVGAIITVVAIITGVAFGNIEMLSLCYSIGFFLNFIKSQWFLSRFCFNETFKNLMVIYLPEGIIMITMFVLMIFVPSLNNLFLSLILKAGVALLIYLIMLCLTKEYRVLFSLLPQKILHKSPNSWKKGE